MTLRPVRIAVAAVLLGVLQVVALTAFGYSAKAASAGGMSPTASARRTDASTPAKLVFAVVGDYGVHGKQELAVAKLCGSWDASFVVGVGDNYYSTVKGTGSDRYYNSAGFAYGKWMADVPKHHGKVVGTSKVNAFFPVLGNEDYNLSSSVKPYRDYFTLPGKGFTSSSGNERYYDFVIGRIHFFMVDSDHREPKGVSANSAQGRWLKTALASSESSWNVVVEHHPPYTSCVFGLSPYMRWPYKKWGADLVLSGHAHVYERVVRDGLTYVDDGLGGASLHPFGSPIAGSKIRFNRGYGAMRGTVEGDKLIFEFRTTSGRLVDRFSLPAHG